MTERKLTTIQTMVLTHADREFEAMQREARLESWYRCKPLNAYLRDASARAMIADAKRRGHL